MEAIIFCGLQAAGKSTFYRERFFQTHVRVSLDLLRTRHRERSLLAWCIEHRQRFVVDNTNPTIAERDVYISAARDARFRVIGYVFIPDVTGSISRNAQRSGRERIPSKAIPSTKNRLQPPQYAEGFDQLYSVRIKSSGGFLVEEQPHAI